MQWPFFPRNPFVFILPFLINIFPYKSLRPQRYGEPFFGRGTAVFFVVVAGGGGFVGGGGVIVIIVVFVVFLCAHFIIFEVKMLIVLFKKIWV